MSELLVLGFQNIREADRALTGLLHSGRSRLADLEDAVVAIRWSDGVVRVKQTANVAAPGGPPSAAWGGFVLRLLRDPRLHFAGRAAGGDGEHGIGDDAVQAIGGALQPGTSALFVRARTARLEDILADLAGFMGPVVRCALPPEREQRFRDAAGID